MADLLQQFTDALETGQGEFEDRVLKTIEVAQRQKEQKFREESRDLQRISNYEARLGNKLNNYIASGDIYNESKMSELKNSVNSLYEQESKRNPELISEFSDERDSMLGVINNYSTKNKEKDALLTKINPTKEKLFSIVETLSGTNTVDMTPDEKVKFREQVLDTMEEITKLDKVVDDPYFANLSGWSNVVEDVKYGLKDASQQLITQINTWDSKNNVISPQDLQNLERAVFDNDTKGIRDINESITEAKKTRMQNYRSEYAKHLKEYQTIASFSNTAQYKKMETDRLEEYNKLEGQDKINADNDPNFWFTFPEGNIEGMPKEGINLQNVVAQKIALRAKAETIDANYRNENITGDSIAEILNKPLPWAREDAKKDSSKFPFDIATGKKTILDLVDKGAGESVETNLETPIETMETEEVEENFETEELSPALRLKEFNKNENEKYAKKYNTTADHINSLRESYDEDDTATMDFPTYLNREANEGEFKKLSTEDAPKETDVINSLSRTITNKRDRRYGDPLIPSTNFGARKLLDKAQSNLSSIVSDKFDNLSAQQKGKYKGSKEKAKRLFIKDKFEDWLKSTGKYGKGYAEGDYIYFYPTKGDSSGKVNKNDSLNLFKIYDPKVYGTGKLLSSTREINEDAYPKFTKDFDAFRKYLKGL